MKGSTLSASALAWTRQGNASHVARWMQALSSGLGVRLHHVIADRPGRRDAVMVRELVQVAFTHPVEGSPVELGGPAHEVVDLPLERMALAVEPGVG